MKIYHINAERHFFDKVQSFSANPSRWRMIHFQHLAGERDGQSRALGAMMRDALKEEECYLYEMMDGDILVLLQGAVTPVFEKIAARLDGAMPDLLNVHAGCISNATDDCHYYDLSLAFNKAALLADIKLAAAERFMREQIRASSKEVVIPQATLHWDDAVFAVSAKARAARSGMQVLIIEDDSFTARLVGNIIRKECEVHDAASGYLGMASYLRMAPDMVFLDIELPDSNGHALLKQMIAHDPEAYIVMLSGNSQKENVVAALKDGAKGFVTKPFAREKVVHYVKQATLAKAQRSATTFSA